MDTEQIKVLKQKKVFFEWALKQTPSNMDAMMTFQRSIANIEREIELLRKGK